jgi:hypothetical protein
VVASDGIGNDKCGEDDGVINDDNANDADDGDNNNTVVSGFVPTRTNDAAG